MKYTPYILTLLVGLLLGFFIGTKYSISPKTSPDKTENRERTGSSHVNKESEKRYSDSPARQNATNGDVPSYALETLQYIEEHGEAPEGYVGGRKFQNRENKLPKKSADGSQIQYQEWDVHPKVQGKNRGAERLVTGNEKSAYYTADHYRSFIKIK